MNRRSPSLPKPGRVLHRAGVLLVLLLCTASLLAGCQGVQIQPKGQIQTGVSVGGRR
ncbi:MAG TPA: hypothetical protein H9894_07395 [Candidatus Desulfovibrio intestinipullorum]|uniref:Uncharacterized protein n=1 Tax=Candidatus Desulfovibrio intestinipullorum TaxID=2838536 RepID=A0A9D1TPS6_9BACT|nr:hypothetical protein [Candidatus Desulfovibrio intestinipullorum]